MEHHLIEETASYDENLLEKYLERKYEEELKLAIRKGCLEQYLCSNFMWIGI